MQAGLLGNMTLEEAIERVPHRTYLAMIAWLEDEWNKPDRHDWYLMQVAQQIRNKKSKDPVKMETMKIPFTMTAKEEPSKEDEKAKREMAAAIQKAKWFGITGYKGKPNAGI